MAFGFFKKNDAVDVIFENANIYTNNPDLPWAEAVAVKDGKIAAVGNSDDMEALKGKNTKVHDLGGKFMYPGFIDVHRSPVMNVFKGRCLDLFDCFSTEDVIEAVRNWAEEHDDKEVIFGYGYREEFRPEENSLALLDEAESERPVLLLSRNCVSSWPNTAALNIVKESAEEECVEVVTLPYVLNLLVPFDFDEIDDAVKSHTESLSDAGFTSVLNLQSPEYFEELFRDALLAIYNEGSLKQRFFGSFYVNRPLIPDSVLYTMMNRRNTCVELDDMMHAEVLNINLDEVNERFDFELEPLKMILEPVSERGFTIFCETGSYDDLLKAYQALEYIRSKGCKNDFVIATDLELKDEDAREFIYSGDAITTFPSEIYARNSINGPFRSMEERIEQLTTVAARIIGMSDLLGSIEHGKLADFSIYEDDLLKASKPHGSYHCAMTVLGGEIVYDADSEADMELYNLMANQQI